MALVEIASFSDPVAAQIACGHLAAEGIEAIVFDAGLSGLGLGNMTPARLMVDEDDRIRAERLLSAADGPRAD
jgi:hypothetical protein